jgi:hypothetical protein
LFCYGMCIVICFVCAFCVQAFVFIRALYYD